MSERNFRRMQMRDTHVRTDATIIAGRIWIAVSTTVVLAIVARSCGGVLSHGGLRRSPVTVPPASHEDDGANFSANARFRAGAGGTLRPAYAGGARCPKSSFTPRGCRASVLCLGRLNPSASTLSFRFYGNVQVDERRQAYAQTRFAGWIAKSYADARAILLARARPLFTIYSPDLVSTEHEYLAGKEELRSLQQSKVSG